MSEAPISSGQYIVVKLPRELDLYNAENVKKKIMTVIESSVAAVIFDCSALIYLDSSGLGVLVYAHTKLLQKRKPFCFSELKGAPAQVIKMTCLNGVFPIEDSLEEAETYMRRKIGI